MMTPFVSPFTVHRVNGLPVEALDLEMPQTDASLRLETELEQQLDDVSAKLSDALHALVPTLDETPALRRKVLNLRRAMHNRRLKAFDAVEDVAALLDPVDRARLDSWLTTAGRLTRQYTETEARYEAEAERATRRLREILEEPRLAQGLALANRHVLLYLSSDPLTPRSKAARSVLGYVTRAALKTSPFSHLTALALDGMPADGSGHTYVAQQHVRSWLDALARDHRFAPVLEVEPNDSVRYSGGAPRLLIPSYNNSGEGGSTAWRTDTLTDASAYAPLLRQICSWPRMSVAECLELIGGADPFAAYVRLLDTGWLRLVLPWRPDDARPLTVLADRLRQLDGVDVRATARLLSELEQETAQLSGLPGADRARNVERLAALTRPDDAGSPRPAAPFAVYEDATSDVRVDLPVSEVSADIAELGALIRPYIFRSHLYDWLCEEFTVRYGAGGRCDDVLDFLWDVAADPAHDQKFARALTLDHRTMGGPTDRAWLPVSASSAPPTTAVLYQVAAASADEIRAGRHRVVINQYNPGMGGLVARFRHLLDAPGPAAPGDGGLTPRLRDWICAAYPDATPRQLTLSGDVNGMHRVADAILPGRLDWPGEPGASGVPRAPFTGIAVHHSTVDDTLSLTGPDGLPVAPVYLGVVPLHLIPGVSRLLLCLADPWVNGSRQRCTRSPLDTAPAPAPDEMQVIPPVEHGRLVLGRRTWRCAPGLIPRPEQGENAVAFHRRVHRWRLEHGMPDQVFLSVESAVPMGDQSAAKPAWLSFRSPHAVWAALSRIGGADSAAIRFAEMSPKPDEFWVRDGRGLTRAAEHVSLLRWDRPVRKEGR
ncbi:hypothetical protein J7F03_00505 [Streptomyces sp. ISL-43]|uniref:lantibiotic dehydratase family protein n=1 Tax=Streptomyces sp. ISL-43 TaxID=2819183 RepID=UPI001BEC986A|nr:lantibiotic dehydratase family protein [Streptomyces sp. ISL-43]MBT2445591.1 hypothetical protein [Streptomyces sp. ISL-43]